MDLRRIINPVKPFHRPLPSILTIIITAESKLKQMDASLQVLDCYNRSRHKKRNPVVATFILPEFVNYVSFFLRNLLYLILEEVVRVQDY